MTTTEPADFQDRIVKRYDAPMYRAMLEVYGDQIHPGFIRSPDDDLVTAALRPTARLADLANLRTNDRVLETACGVGGTARFLVAKHGVRVVATNISREQLAIAQARTPATLDITYEFADFQALPFADGGFDVYLCQDSLLYAVDRPKALAEAWRVLRPGGTLAISDLLAAGPAPSADLAATMAALSAVGFWSVAAYRDRLAAAGFALVAEEDWTRDLPEGYGRVRAEILRKRETLVAMASAAEVQATIDRYDLWCKAVAAGCLGWGAFIARKPG